MNLNATIAVTIVPLNPTHVDACEQIARAMPAWFGIEEGLQDLRHRLETESGLVALRRDEVVGFLTTATPFPETWEITWMAVSPNHHRRGIGRALVEALAALATAEGVAILHVKTLADLHLSAEYARTRAFYLALGFQRLVVLPELWGPENPCLLMVRPLT